MEPPKLKNSDPIILNYPLYVLGVILGSLHLALSFYDYRRSQLFLIIPSVFMLGHTILVVIVFSWHTFQTSSRGVVSYIYYLNNYAALVIGIGAVISLCDDFSIYYEPFLTNCLADAFGLFVLSAVYFCIGCSIQTGFHSTNLPPKLIPTNPKDGKGSSWSQLIFCEV